MYMLRISQFNLLVVKFCLWISALWLGMILDQFLSKVPLYLAENCWVLIRNFRRAVVRQDYDINRNHCGYTSCQWETTLHCNVVSHWLGAYTKWSLHQVHKGVLLILLLILLLTAKRIQCMSEDKTLFKYRYNRFNKRPSDWWSHDSWYHQEVPLISCSVVITDRYRKWQKRHMK